MGGDRDNIIGDRTRAGHIIMDRLISYHRFNVTIFEQGYSDDNAFHPSPYHAQAQAQT